MLYALISDIHSNVEALEAVLKDAEAQGVQEYLCLGDIVGYGAEPHECLERIRKLGGVIIAGNHDQAVCGKTDTSYFNTYARRAVQWTIQQLPPEDISFLASLPLTYRTDQFCLVHASLDGPQNWEYIFVEEDALRSFQLLKEQVLFIGHSHVPFVFSYRDGRVTGCEPKDFSAGGGSRPEADEPLAHAYGGKLDAGVKYIVNIGSVGQPRDLDPRSSYCLFDSEGETVRFRRVVYDFRRTQKKILDAELPEILALRLEMGR